ncbi:MAG: hypothetical protein VXV93_01300 [Pseudomonadota bacterium]|nr:hypothetical protein [Pseudomonadota bacterium]
MLQNFLACKGGTSFGKSGIENLPISSGRITNSLGQIVQIMDKSVFNRPQFGLCNRNMRYRPVQSLYCRQRAFAGRDIQPPFSRGF